MPQIGTIIAHLPLKVNHKNFKLLLIIFINIILFIATAALFYLKCKDIFCSNPIKYKRMNFGMRPKLLEFIVNKPVKPNGFGIKKFYYNQFFLTVVS